LAAGKCRCEEWRGDQVFGFLRRAACAFTLKRSSGLGYIQRPDGLPVTNDYLLSDGLIESMDVKWLVLTAHGSIAHVHLKTSFDPRNLRVGGFYWTFLFADIHLTLSLSLGDGILPWAGCLCRSLKERKWERKRKELKRKKKKEWISNVINSLTVKFSRKIRYESTNQKEVKSQVNESLACCDVSLSVKCKVIDRADKQPVSWLDQHCFVSNLPCG
jgi:hypothetical protein